MMTNRFDEDAMAHRRLPTDAELAQRNAAHETEIYLLVGRPEAVALVCGFVPQAVRRQARAAIDWEFYAGKRRQPKRGRR
jgi:hypothetical protein